MPNIKTKCTRIVEHGGVWVPFCGYPFSQPRKAVFILWGMSGHDILQYCFFFKSNQLPVATPSPGLQCKQIVLGNVICPISLRRDSHVPQKIQGSLGIASLLHDNVDDKLLGAVQSKPFTTDEWFDMASFHTSTEPSSQLEKRIRTATLMTWRCIMHCGA